MLSLGRSAPPGAEPMTPHARAAERIVVVDLHIHTACSDGVLSPEAVVERAAGRGLRAIAITDHDTVDGNAEALEAGRRRGIAVVPGVEISTQWEGTTFHLLGYGMRRRPKGVRDTFDFLERSRRERNPRMVEKLRALGIEITLDEVAREAGGSLVGRPHFARVLLARGVVSTVQEAFDRLLGRGAAAYVDKERLVPAAAVELIREAGGVAVLAHPGLIEADRPGLLPRLLDHLIGLGLAGLEAFYSGHSEAESLRYAALAARRGLLVSGGSDFHRPGEGGPELGVGFGGLRVPDSCYETLVHRISSLA